MHKNRGKISKRERARQLRDYRGLRFGTITPTDIDGLIEYQDKAYVIFELKYLDTELPAGQRLALQRLTDDLERSGKPTLCIIASHNTHDYNEDIDAANASVTEYRLKRKWIPLSPELRIPLRKVIALFLDNFKIGSEDFQWLCVENSNVGGYKVE